MMRLILGLIALVLLFQAPVRAEDLVFYPLEDEALERVNAFRAALGQVERAPCLRAWESLPALELSEPLNQAAREFLRRAVAEQSFNHVLPDGSSPLARVRAQGYEPLLVGESLAYLGFENYLPPEEALSVVLDWLLGQALLQETPEAAPFVFPAYRHFGLAMAGVTISIEGQTYNFYLFCFVLAVPAQEDFPFTIGRLYDDRDQDGVATPEEGLAGVKVVFEPLEGEGKMETCTLSDGTFFLPVGAPGLLRFEVSSEGLSFPRLRLVSPSPVFVQAPTPRVWSNLTNAGQI